MSNKNRLALVTGGAGFIGSHVVDELVAQGRPVRVFDNFSTGLRSNLENAAAKIEIIDGDLTDASQVDAALRDVDVVIHLGALASVQRSVEAPLMSYHACLTGTLHVLDAARRLGIRRVVYAASSSAYGGRVGDVQRESDPISPMSPYAAAKVGGEFFAQAFSSCYGLETVSLRFFNVFGPRQRSDSPYSGVIAIFTDMMLKGQRPTIHGDGLQSRDFTYIGDTVQAILKASEVPGVSGKVYNVGTGRRVTLLDLVAALNRILGTDLAPSHGELRAGDVRHSRADISAIQKEMGYEPRFPFEEGLKRTLDWHKQAVGK